MFIVGRPVNIYLDTNLWNVLCDRVVDPTKLMASLAAKNASLVLSTHTFYELAKTFRTSTREALERGRKLFSYLKEFIEANTPCAKENTELLVAEMWALKSRTLTADAFLDGEGYASLSKEVGRLANGEFDERADKFIKERGEFALNTRLSQIRHLENRSDVKLELKKVAPDKLERWLREKTFSPTGVAILTSHILRQFPDAPKTEVVGYASALRVFPVGRMASGLIRADLYYNWRCAYRDSNPKDLIDDVYHVLNSVHCGVYATEEKRQAEYAGLLLSPNTRVAIYDGRAPIDRWLQDLA